MNTQRANLTKAAYTPKELIALGIVGSRTSLHRFVDAGKLRMVKRGSNSVVLLEDVNAFLDGMRAIPACPSSATKRA
ncbi:MAG: type IV toxin-antitoxin system AbiEi family antitoxin domain-containing protein [Alphaproteobacteria bacterium]|nr:type IV toxin-antitoxin system AbiEi family antitoxin domain-containing protein [Alphaproteobacteria bacterium]